jgi:SAM-dependent methyltransferase
VSSFFSEDNTVYPTEQYFNNDYLAKNPGWHSEDSAWKARVVTSVLYGFGLSPSTICEVGCGTGAVLAHLRSYFPNARLSGWDVSPQAADFWHRYSKEGIAFTNGDFNEENRDHYDLVLMLDVIEHLTNPFEFLTQLKRSGEHFMFHIPLDLSVNTVLRAHPLSRARSKLGHLNFYTKDLALATLTDCGFNVIDWKFTGASTMEARRSFKGKLLALPRLALSMLSKEFAARVLGGETMIVLAKASKP